MKKWYKKYESQLQKLVSAKPKERIEIIKNATPRFIQLIVDAVFNVLKGNLRIVDRHYKKLRPHKRTLLFLAKKSNSIESKRNALLRKKGGFIPVILAPLVASLAGAVFDKIIDTVSN